MSDHREEIMQAIKEKALTHPTMFYEQEVKEAMDIYMRETCLELLEYMAKLGVSCGEDSKGHYFIIKDEEFTKDELFKNFL